MNWDILLYSVILTQSEKNLVSAFFKAKFILGVGFTKQRNNLTIYYNKLHW